MVAQTDLRLVPLRIPGGWLVSLNKLLELPPESEPIVPAVGREAVSKWMFLDGTLLYLTNARRRVVIDVSWLPEYSPDGEYVCQLLRETPPRSGPSPVIREIASTSLEEVVKVVTEWLADATRRDL